MIFNTVSYVIKTTPGIHSLGYSLPKNKMLPVIKIMSIRDFKKRLGVAKGKAKGKADKAKKRARQRNYVARNTTCNEARAMIRNARKPKQRARVKPLLPNAARRKRVPNNHLSTSGNQLR